MAEITLVRKGGTTLTDEQRAVMRAALFDMVDGLGEVNQRAWRRFWNRILHLGAGEVFSVDTWVPRYLPFHKRHMKIEASVFAAQERIKSFDQFRYWLKLGAGFVDWMPGPKGGVVPVPRSISFKKCEEDVMRQFHDDAMDFLRTEHACKYLWPNLSLQAAGEAMDAVLGRFVE